MGTKALGCAGTKVRERTGTKATVRTQTNVMAWAGTKALVSVATDRAVTSGKRIEKRNISTPINTLTFGISSNTKAPLRWGFLLYRC